MLALLQLSPFQLKNPEHKEDDKGIGEIEKMGKETSSNFDQCWHGGLDVVVEEKFEGAKVATTPH